MVKINTVVGKIIAIAVVSGFLAMLPHNARALVEVDSTFTPGVTTKDSSSTPTTPEPSKITDVCVQPDGKYIVVGLFDHYNGTTVNGITRINVDGSVDQSFSGTGFDNGVGLSCAIDADGKIIVGGHFITYKGQPVSHGIVRLLPNGDVDTSFTADGIQNYYISPFTVPIGMDTWIYYAGIGEIRVLPNGRIAYISADDSRGRYFVLNDDGSTFVAYDAASVGIPADIEVLPSGNQLIAGHGNTLYEIPLDGGAPILRSSSLVTGGFPQYSFIKKLDNDIISIALHYYHLNNATSSSSSTTLFGADYSATTRPVGVYDFYGSKYNNDRFADGVRIGCTRAVANASGDRNGGLVRTFSDGSIDSSSAYGSFSTVPGSSALYYATPCKIQVLDNTHVLHAEVNTLRRFVDLPKIVPSASSVQLDSEVAQTTVSLVLDTKPTSDVVVSVRSSDTNEATVSTSSLTFTSANWNTPQTVTITGVDDTNLRDETVRITVEADAAANGPTSTYVSSKPEDITVSIANTDTASDQDGIADTVEDSVHGGDGDADTTADKEQVHVASFKSTGYDYGARTADMTIAADSACRFTATPTVVNVAKQATGDVSYAFPIGMMGYELACASSVVTIYLDKPYDTSTWKYRKYNSKTKQYSDMTSYVTYGTATVNGKQVTTISYTLTDGGPLDEDGIVNGVIVDPAGPAIAEQVATPATTVEPVATPEPQPAVLAETGVGVSAAFAGVVLLLGAGAMVYRHRK